MIHSKTCFPLMGISPSPNHCILYVCVCVYIYVTHVYTIYIHIYVVYTTNVHIQASWVVQQ